MVAPVRVTLTADTWIKVADGVTGATVVNDIKLKNTADNLAEYMFTTVDAGGTAPTGTDLAVPMTDCTLKFEFDSSTDIYMYAMGQNGSVLAFL